MITWIDTLDAVPQHITRGGIDEKLNGSKRRAGELMAVLVVYSRKGGKAN